MPDKANTSFYVLFVSGIMIELMLLGFYFIPAGKSNIAYYIIIYFIISVIMFSLYWFIVKRKTSSNKNELYVIILFAILFRITLIPSELSTSGDVYRYLWEGKVVAHGFNPYENAPDDARLSHLRSGTLVNKLQYKNTTAIYPPVAQYMFALSYILFGENVAGIEIIYLFTSIVSMYLIILLLRHKKIDERSVIIYAWLPLPIMEYFINAHLDIVGVLFFLLFIYLFLQEKYYLSSAAFALSILTKIYPVMFIPLIFRKLGWKRSLYFSLITVVIIILFYLPFIPKERELSESLFRYISHWSFNGSVFKIFYLITEHNQKARIISYILFGITLIYIFYRNEEFFKSVYLFWIAYIIFTPTLYPWYLGWIAAINPVFSFASVNSLLLTIDVSNFTPLSDKWTEYWWTAVIQYVPFYSLLIYDLLKHRKKE